jgi:hypothetical protein
MAMGVPEGPAVGAWCRLAYEAQLDGRFADRHVLLDWLKAGIAHGDVPEQ